jgi:hypothetical protein
MESDRKKKRPAFELAEGRDGARGDLAVDQLFVRDVAHFVGGVIGVVKSQKARVAPETRVQMADAAR